MLRNIKKELGRGKVREQNQDRQGIVKLHDRVKMGSFLCGWTLNHSEGFSTRLDSKMGVDF